jgi:hypothetical protein
MIYLYKKVHDDDGNYAELVVLDSLHMKDARNEIKRLFKKEADDWGYFETAKSRLGKMAKEYKEMQLLDVIDEETIDVEKIIGELIKEIDDEIKNRDEEKERREYERLKAKFGDK